MVGYLDWTLKSTNVAYIGLEESRLGVQMLPTYARSEPQKTPSNTYFLRDRFVWSTFHSTQSKFKSPVLRHEPVTIKNRTWDYVWGGTPSSGDVQVNPP